MELDSVRELKRELMEGSATHRGRTTEDLPPRARITASAFPRLGQASAIALGIESRNGDFWLAVRIQAVTPGTQTRLDEIRARACGEISVRLTGRVVKQQPFGRARPLQIGVSIGHVKTIAGTLGCFVSDGGAPLILSNNHVLADENEGTLGDPVVQPGPVDGGQEPIDTVARLSMFVPLAAMPGRNRVDVAAARIEAGIGIVASTLPGLGELAGLRTSPLETDEVVFKVGRTTGVTQGRVTAIELDDLTISYDRGDLTFDDQIEIAPIDPAQPFSRGGDSGSLIVDRQLRAVALLFAGNGVDVTYANPIAEVLDALDVQLA
jgi:hypothetical protein